MPNQTEEKYNANTQKGKKTHFVLLNTCLDSFSREVTSTMNYFILPMSVRKYVVKINCVIARQDTFYIKKIRRQIQLMF